MPAPIQILLIEDNEADVWLIRKAFEEADFPNELTLLRDGADALAFLQDANSHADRLPDLVLMDLNLPRVDGTSLLHVFREQPKLENIPLVLLSSSQSPNDRAKAQQVRHGLFLMKPSDLDEFLALGRKIKAFWEECRGAERSGTPA